MRAALPYLTWWVGCASTVLGTLYAVIAVLALRPGRRSPIRRAGALRPVTLLKPLCGMEPELYECLRSFCLQGYPQMQLVFGVANPLDPAAIVVRRLQREFPTLDIDVIVDGTRHGNNPKVCNLLNMMNHVKHDWLVVADSDIIVARDYVERVAASLDDEEVGIVTCAYLGRPGQGLWSSLGVEFIRGWFTPSVFVANLLGSRTFAFGATIAMRRQVLDAIGGFRAVVNHLADDYRLGEAVRSLGFKAVLSDVVVETTVSEASFRALAKHQLRWMRTIRGVRPVGYAFAGVTFSLPVALLGCLLTRLDPRMVALAGVILVLRSVISLSLSRFVLVEEILRIPLIPVSDALAFGLWCAGFLGRQVVWRKNSFTIDRDGLVFPAGHVHRSHDGIKQPSPPLSSGETS